MPHPIDASIEQSRTVLKDEDWQVQRYGTIEEITYNDGRVVYRVKIWDAGREPFTTVNFNDYVPALDLFERVKEQNTRMLGVPHA